MSVGKTVKELIESLKAKDAGAEALCKTFVPLIKRLKVSQITEVLEALEKKEHKNIWANLLRHVEAVIIELQASNGEDGFDAVGSTVSKVGEDDSIVYGKIVEAVEGNDHDDENALFWSVMYDDGSNENIPFNEIQHRIIKETEDNEETDNVVQESGEKVTKSNGGGLGEESVEALNTVAVFALSWLQYRGKSGLIQLDAPGAMLDTVILLHDVLFDLSGLDGVACQESIARVCETWWSDEREGAELLTLNLLPYLIIHALDEEGKTQDIKRLYAVRGALLLFDFEDECIGMLKGLLVRCVMHPRFISNNGKKTIEEGKKFLVFLFSLHPRLIESLHATIKNQLPLASPNVLSVYGDIYLRAWRASDPTNLSSNTDDKETSPSKNSGVYRRNIETCIQELMNVSIHAANASMHKCCRKVLNPLHASRNIGGCDVMLYKLWEPIIFRALNVANPLVRCNAVNMLSDAFPLGTHKRNDVTTTQGKKVKGSKVSSLSSIGEEGSDGVVLSENELLQKQFDALMSLLEDVDPRVRASACTTTCTILLKFWEAIPSNTSRSLLTTIASKNVRDKTSSLVRSSAIEAMSHLLEQPLCHPVLKNILPHMSTLIHDNNEKVRYTLVSSLLQRVSTARMIKFFDIVSVEHLHARLALDYTNFINNETNDGGMSQTTACSAIVRLFVPSYLPNIMSEDGADDENETNQAKDEIHLKRCLTFLKQSPTAAIAFYSLAYHHVGLNDMINMIELLFNYAMNLSQHIYDMEDGENEENVLKDVNSNIVQEDDEEDGEEEDIDTNAPPTPDKRSKRKHRVSKKNNKGKVNSENNVVLASKKNTSKDDKNAEKRNLVSLTLECASSIFESLTLVFKKNQSNLKLHESLSDRLMDDDEGIPSLYRLLSSSNKHAMKNESSRTNLLKLASCLPNHHINALGPLLLEVLSNCVNAGGNVMSDLTPAVSLLCKCGSSSSIAVLIKESFEYEIKTMKEDGKPDEEKTMEQNDNDQGNGKRKRNKNKKSSSTVKKSSEKEDVLPLTLTLKILKSLSSGSDSLSKQARNHLVSCEDAVETLKDTLKLLMDILTDFCKNEDVNETLDSSKMNMLLESFQVFGRLLTHITVEQTSTGQTLKLSSEMQAMLDWVLNDILPLTFRDNTEMMTSLKASDNICSPQKKQDSQNILSPPMKSMRANGTSPVNGKIAIASNSSKSQVQLSNHRCDIANEMVSSVLSLASDWAACGMSLDALTFSAETCALFLINSYEYRGNGNESNVKDDLNQYIQPSLLGSLGRLTYQLAVQESQGAKCPLNALSLLVRCGSSNMVDDNSPSSPDSNHTSSLKTKKHDTTANNDIVHGCVSQLLTLAVRRGNETLTGLVDYMTNVMIEYSMLPMKQDEDYELEDIHTVCLKSSGLSILKILLKHKHGSKSFFLNLMKRLPSSSSSSNMRIQDMEPSQLLLQSASNLLHDTCSLNSNDKFSVSLLSWTQELGSLFPGNASSPSPVNEKRQLSAIVSN